MRDLEFRICGDYSGAWEPTRGQVKSRLARGGHFFLARWKSGDAELGFFGIYHPALADIEEKLPTIAEEITLRVEQREHWDSLKSLLNFTPGWGLFLASRQMVRIWRDPFGRLPLFFSDGVSRFLEWGTRPAVLSSFSNRPSRSRLGEFLINKGDDRGRSDFFQGSYRLRAGEVLTKIGTARPSFEPWWPNSGVSDESFSQSQWSLESIAGHVEVILKGEVRRSYERGARLVSLSAGVDSSLLAALLTELDPTVEAVSMNEPSAPIFDETTAIKSTLAHLGIQGTFVPIGGPAAWANPELLHPYIDYGPSFVSEPLYYRPFLARVREVADKRRAPRILLSGTGADHLFSCPARLAELDRGNNFLKSPKSLKSRAKNELKNILKSLGMDSLPNFRHDLRTPPWFGGKQRGRLEFRKISSYDREEFLRRRREQFRAWEWEYAVRLFERYRRETGILIEFPFLSPEIAEFAFKLPPSVLRSGHLDKTVLRQILQNRVPDEIISRPKFGILDEIVWAGIVNYLSPNVESLVATSGLPEKLSFSRQRFLRENEELKTVENPILRPYGHQYWRAIAAMFWLNSLEPLKFE